MDSSGDNEKILKRKNRSGANSASDASVARSRTNAPVRSDSYNSNRDRIAGQIRQSAAKDSAKPLPSKRPSNDGTFRQGSIRTDAPTKKKVSIFDKLRSREPVDIWILVLTMILFGLGCVIIFSASYPTAVAEDESPYYYIFKHLKTSGVGFILLIIAAYVPLNWHKLSVVAFTPLAILLLGIVLVIGVASGVAQRWIAVGGFTLQPSEFAKYTVVLFMAFYYSKNKKRVKESPSFKERYIYGVLIPGAVLSVFLVLVLAEPHLSGALIIGLLGYVVMIAGGADVLWLTLTAFGGGGVAAAVFFAIPSNAYALKRLATHTSDSADTASDAWQLTQGQYAIGSGGLFGLGLGNSRQKFSYVSKPQNDFIFTIWCEEMGFIGAVAVIAIFLLLIWRGYVTAINSRDEFARILAFGITTKLAIQFVGNIAVVTGVMPTTGISLPFFSYGGTAIAIQLAEMGVLLAVSRYAVKRRG